MKELTANKYRVSLGNDENVLKLDCSDSCITVNLLKTTDLDTING